MTTGDERTQDGEDLFDGPQIANYGRFVRGAVLRHRWLATFAFLGVVGLTALVLVAMPKTYHVEARLLAQRSQVLVVRGDGPDAGVAPTRGAVETIRGRDTLLAIIQANDLVAHYRDHRSLSQRLAQRVRGLLPHREETEQDRTDAMVDLLDKHLTAWVTDGTVSVAIDWPDAEMARRIVDAAQKSFLAARHAQEVTALAESIAIVAGHGASLKADIDVEVAALEALRSPRATAGVLPEAKLAPPAMVRGGALPSGSSKTPTVDPSPPQGFAEMKAELAAKQRSLDELVAARTRRQAEVEQRLAEQRRVYTDNHPTIVELRQSLAALSAPSPEIIALQSEVSALEAARDHARGAGVPSAPPTMASTTTRASARPEMGTTAVATPPQLPTEILRLDGDLREDRDPAIVYARGRLRDAMDKYALLRAQVQATQIDLETAEAAFKYRYTVVTPAQLPRAPVKPSVPLVLAGAVIAGLFAAIVLAVVRDLRTGKLLERWQIERLLDRPILGEMVARSPASPLK